ncbi:MAG: cytochrome c biogenesis protein CcsA [Candidatus Thermoplasmatota archaeon]|nr:cytochrome c biogenesis protein CcsA [Candidatus Thermoplasmatota archaeon]
MEVGRRPVVMRGVWLMLVGLAIAGTSMVLGFLIAPELSDDFGGESYRIIFWHVPAAWTSFITYGMLFVGSLAWFWKRSEWGWTLAGVAAELSLLYGLFVVTSGPIWGAAAWGVPWDWTDARLNTYGVLSAIALFLVLSRRSQPDTPEFRDVYSGIGLFGFLLVPITYMATRWWQERHPCVTLGCDANGGGESGVDSVILQIWLLAFLGMVILMIGQAMVSWEVQKCERRLAELQQRMD